MKLSISLDDSIIWSSRNRLFIITRETKTLKRERNKFLIDVELLLLNEWRIIKETLFLINIVLYYLLRVLNRCCWSRLTIFSIEQGATERKESWQTGERKSFKRVWGRESGGSR